MLWSRFLETQYLVHTTMTHPTNSGGNAKRWGLRECCRLTTTPVNMIEIRWFAVPFFRLKREGNNVEPVEVQGG